MSKKKKNEENKNDEELKNLLEQLQGTDIDENALKEFETKLKERLQEHEKKYRIRGVLTYLFFAVILFCVNLAAFGFLSKELYVSSWSKGLLYILAVTIISLCLTLVEKGLKLIPNFVTANNIYIIELIKPVVMFIIMLIANYNFNYVVFNHWYGIVFFLLISYAFQFAITYYRIKHQITKLF